MTMEPQPLNVVRWPGEFSSDNTRVLARHFQPGDEERTRVAVQRVLGLDEDEVTALLERVLHDYAHRHRDFEATLQRHFDDRIARFVADPEALSRARRLLLGAYFTMEYSVESAALFNPSIVPHPVQDHVPAGGVRFVMSFRATGEGHVSSIVFRSGVIDADYAIAFDPISRYIEAPEIQKDTLYDKHLFRRSLSEVGVHPDVAERVFDRLSDAFTFDQLEAAIDDVARTPAGSGAVHARTFETMLWLARSNYEMQFRGDRRVSERIIFPVSENERNGIEDARFVRFVDEDGAATYYATYTAYNGVETLPQLIETKDFIRFKVATLNGRAVYNKGMALFPRKVNGHYVMISRQDGVNLHVMFSDHLHFWSEARIIQRPEAPWELTQIGNCGSPIETEAGWLLLTHGVGSMRKYCIGAELLDRDDPSKVIARLDKPVLAPNEYEREGYVPNVVYTCGYMIHKDQLIIPYAMSDTKCAIASLSVSALLERLRPRGN